MPPLSGWCSSAVDISRFCINNTRVAYQQQQLCDAIRERMCGAGPKETNRHQMSPKKYKWPRSSLFCVEISENDTQRQLRDSPGRPHPAHRDAPHIYINTQRTCCWVLALWDAEIGRGCRDRRSRYVDNGLAVARVMPLDTATLERNGFGVCVRGPVHVCCSAGDAAVG